jgi:hypothetical protein
MAGVALVMLAKNGLAGITGYSLLGSFFAAAVVARISAGGPQRDM